MLKKTITYTDYNDVERKEDFYFNLTKAELAEMEYSISGGLQGYIEQIINAQNMPEIMKLFKQLILKSVGEKTVDGKHFRKSEAISDAFCQTEAYSELFMELLNDEEKAAKFIKGILPELPADVPNPIPPTFNK